MWGTSEEYEEEGQLLAEAFELGYAAGAWGGYDFSLVVAEFTWDFLQENPDEATHFCNGLSGAPFDFEECGSSVGEFIGNEAAIEIVAEECAPPPEVEDTPSMAEEEDSEEAEACEEGDDGCEEGPADDGSSAAMASATMALAVAAMVQ